MIERTLVLVKPDGVQRGLSGRIISRFEDVGLKIVGMKMHWVDKEFAKKHYCEHVEKAFYPGLETMITEGPVLAMVLEGLHAVELVRKMVGATEPKSAQPGTIRGDYCIDVGRNVIHGSDAVESANAEIALWFRDDELVSWEDHSDAWVYE